MTVEPSLTRVARRRVLRDHLVARDVVGLARDEGDLQPALVRDVGRLARLAPHEVRHVDAVAGEREVRADGDRGQRDRPPAPTPTSASARSSSSTHGSPGVGSITIGRVGARRAPSSAAMNSSALWKRRAGSFSSARMTTASSAGGMPGRSWPGGTGRSLMCLIAIEIGASPSNGTLAGQQLVEHDADRVEVRAAVDRLALGLLGREVLRRCRRSRRSGSSPTSRRRARSRSRRPSPGPSRSMITFCGLTSRWTIPRRCA